MATRLLAAACHVSPIPLSAQKTTEKCIQFINRAASNSANLIVFPESFIPTFPIWSSILAPTQNHAFFELMARESVFIDGEEINAIREAARKNGVMVSLGISEKVRGRHGTLFNSNLIVGEDGEMKVHHRKLMPTWFEKLTWAPGDGHGLRIAELGLVNGKARIGALICGENTNPLARYALMAQGEQVHISTWPTVWPSVVLKSVRKMDSEGGTTTGKEHGKRLNYDNVAANRTRAAAHCFEGKCFGILCAGHLDDANIQAISEKSSEPSFVSRALEAAPRAATMFLDPTGIALPGYVVDPNTGEKNEKEILKMEEDILYSEMELEKCVEGKQYHDVVGGYQRFDVFDLKVDRTRRDPITFVSEEKIPWK
ncbi:related to aliphatic nitrilase [Phialocephala subalpina]|uniref:Related to aliphatic nitrilase n=1 Tax=Phialocephala subalpina TaxID=576137 RepID=A0A1L7X0Q6_9HELO|nr:related to aliphatic nitrilase [Phialocephala subalpina]